MSLDRWKRWEAGAIVMIALCGAALRFVNLNKKPYWFDEAFTALRASGYDEHDQANPSLYTGRVITCADIQTFQRANSETSVVDTIRGLARKEPQLPPAYFVAARMAAQSVGATVTATRGVSALCGVLSILAMFWLGFEWSGGFPVARVSAALVAVSPLFLQHSQEARPYSMWVLLVLLAGAAFVRMNRNPGAKIAAIYCLLLVLALYTHVLSVLVMAVHGTYLLLERRPARVSRLFLWVCATATAAFLPWIGIMTIKSKPLLASTGHLARPMPAGGLKYLAHQVCTLFLGWPVSGPGMFFLVVAILLWIVYVLYFLHASTSRSTWLFALLLSVIPVALFVLWDAAAGGQRSMRVRYMLPGLLAVELAIAHLLAWKMNEARGVRVYLWRGVAAAILLAGLVSSAASVQADTWWDLAEVEADVGRILNQSPHPLVISDVPFGVLAALSHSVHPGVSFLLARQPDSLVIPDRYDTVYVYQPSDRLREAVRDRLGMELSLVYRKARWDGAVYSLYRAGLEGKPR